MLYRDEDPLMASEDLLAPMNIHLAFSVPNLGEESPPISILGLKRYTGNKMALSCVFAD